MFKVKRSEIALLDFQYCHGNENTIYMKEMAYMVGTSITPNYFIFKPPFDVRELSKAAMNKNNYCKKFVNGLDWSMGTVDYNCVGDTLSPLDSYKYVFVVGKTKQDFLSQYLKTNVINLENVIRLKNIDNLYSKYICPIHADVRFKCAQNNLYKMIIFVENNYKKILQSIMTQINYY